MHAETCGRIATMAMHGLQSLEGRKFACRDPQAPTVYVLPCLSDVRRHKVLRRLSQSESERQVFHRNVAKEACRRAVLFVLCDESLWLVDMQWLRLEEKTRSLKSVLATFVSRTGSNTARTAGSHAWPEQSLSRQWHGWHPDKPK